MNETSTQANHPPAFVSIQAQLTIEVEMLRVKLDRAKRHIQAVEEDFERLLTVVKVAYVALHAGVRDDELVKLQEGLSRAIAEEDPSWTGIMAVADYEEVMRA